MVEKLQIYKCSVCGNITMVMHASIGILVCCGKPMILQDEKTTDVGNEKHVPVIEEAAAGVLVRIGSIPHPMEEKHFIEWVEIQKNNDEVNIKFLKPGQKPEAEFNSKKDMITKAREYCNLHGLWKK